MELNNKLEDEMTTEAVDLIMKLILPHNPKMDREGVRKWYLENREIVEKENEKIRNRMISEEE